MAFSKNRARGVRMIIEELPDSRRPYWVHLRYAEGDKEPRSFRKRTSPREIDVMNYLRSRGVELPQFRVIGNDIYLKAAGTPLANYLRGRPKLSQADCRAVALQLAERLGQMHRNHVSHGDILDHNILWDAAARKVYLVDFGDSRMRRIMWQTTSAEKIVGEFQFDLARMRGVLIDLGAAKDKRQFMAFFRELFRHYPVSEAKKHRLLAALEKSFQKHYGQEYWAYGP